MHYEKLYLLRFSDGTEIGREIEAVMQPIEYTVKYSKSGKVRTVKKRGMGLSSIQAAEYVLTKAYLEMVIDKGTWEMELQNLSNWKLRIMMDKAGVE